jgi:hypothetical protein
LRAGLRVALALAATCAVARAEAPIADLRSVDGIRIAREVTHAFGNAFVLEDETGSVLVETGPEWFAERTFAVGERLVVTGEMDGGEFDAFTVTRADGSVDRIRPAAGPPPWAGRE